MGGWSLARVKQRNLKLTVCRLADLPAPRWIPGGPKATDISRYRSLSGELRPHGLAGALLQQFAGVLRKNVIHLCQIAFGESPTRRTRVRLSLFGRLRAGDNGGHRGA